MDIIISLYNELKKIRVYLIKLGPKRRVGKNLETKLNEINEVYRQYQTWLLDYEKKVKSKYFSSENILLINNYCGLFLELYNEVLLLCRSDKSESVSNMDSFDMKTALSLLPIMTNEESNTKQLIDNIQYYASILKENSCKQNLINFVLKCRLSQDAKLKLRTKYETVDELITDMKNVLLCKKAATAIHKKLQITKQNESSIEDYGKKIAELFVDLTISQSDGVEQCYNILKPINEKMAIKQFADGLRNRRLSTIISARNYSSLKDAIQAAQDEEVSSASASGEVMGMYRKPYNYFNNRSRPNMRRSQRGGRNFSTYRGQSRSSGYWHLPTTRGQAEGHRGYKGNSNFYRGNQRIRNQRNINFINQSENTAEPSTSNQFFRD